MSSQLPAGSLTRTVEMRCGAGGLTSGEEEQQQQQQLRVNNPGCDTETQHQCGSADKKQYLLLFLAQRQDLDHLLSFTHRHQIMETLQQFCGDPHLNTSFPLGKLSKDIIWNLPQIMICSEGSGSSLKMNSSILFPEKPHWLHRCHTFASLV